MKEFQSTLYEMSVPFISKDVSDLIFSRSTSINYKDLFYINSRKMCSWSNVPIKSEVIQEDFAEDDKGQLISKCLFGVFN